MATSTHVSTTVEGGVLIANITTNSLSQYEAGVVETEIVKEAPRTNWRIILNFEPVQFLASAGIGMIISLHRQAKSHSGAIVVCNLANDIHEVMKMTRVDRLFPIVDSLEAAKKKIG